MEWSEIALLVVGILLLLAGGYIKELIGQIKELVDAVAAAIEDGEVNDIEVARILREAKDVREAIMAIVALIRH
jgi:hypothetical protein